MAKEKFNPIAQLPILPGAEVVNDEVETNIIDSTYPPIPVTDLPNKDVKNPQIEIRLKPAEPDVLIIEKEKNKHLTLVRTIILICLIALVLFGMFLTLNFVPKIASNVSNFSRSFTSTLVSNNAASPTTTNTPAKMSVSIAFVATSTPKTIAIAPTTNQSATNQPIVNKPFVTQSIVQPTVTSQPKSPARLVAGILSTNIVGNQTVVKFNVQNVGGTSSGPWSFSATLPSSMTPMYYSVEQDSLASMDGVIYTLSFTPDQYNQNTPVQIILYTNQGNVNSY